MLLIEAWFDGVCEPTNPGGHAAYGALMRRNGKVFWQVARHVGHGPKISNNVAEYAAVLAILYRLEESQEVREIVIRGDSKLVINQLGGRWRARRGLYLPFYRRAKVLTKTIQKSCGGNLKFEWVPRDQNGECDQLSKQVLRDMGIEFRLQPEGE